LLAITLIAAAAAGGLMTTYLWDRESPLGARLAAGTSLGLAACGLIGFLFAMLFGFGVATTVATALLIASPLILLEHPPFRRTLRADLTAAARAVRSVRRPRADLVLLTIFCAMVALVFANAVYSAPDGIYTGVFANRNDLPLHVAIVRGFLEGGNFPPQHPEFAGAPLTYPFLVDFIAAQFAAGGLSFERAMLIQNLVLLSALVVLLHRWAMILTGSRVAATITPLLVLAGSGLGWLVMLREYAGSDASLIPFLADLPRDYTINTHNLRWGNLTTTMLVSQRSALLGLPLFLVVQMAWWMAVRDENTHRRTMVAAGVAGGLLPLAHPHTFGVMMLVALGLALLFPPRRAWCFFFVVALAIALPQLAWVSRGSMVEGTSFIGWHYGWTKGSDSLWWFWFKNTGLFIPLLAAAVLMRRQGRLVSPTLLRFYLPFVVCFVLPMLVRLSPRVSGNIKVLVYWYIASAPLVALVLARLWDRRTLLARTAVVGAVLSLTLATALECWRVVSGASAVRVFDSSEVAFADAVDAAIPPKAVIAHAPSRNHAIFLTGRLSLLGNPSHVESHGFDYRTRESELERIYAGEPDAENLLAAHRIDYLVVGPEERAALHVNEAFLARYPSVTRVGGFTLYRVSSVYTAVTSAHPEPN
jgi:hypothetical protein